MKSSQINQNLNEVPDNIRNAQFGTNPLTTQINCVIRVLQESIELVKISLILPQILENPNRVKNVLSGTQYQPALRLLDDYILRRDIIIREQRPPLSDHGMIKIIDYFQLNHKMHELFPDMFKNLTVDDHNLFITFERLLKVCEQNLLRNAKKEINNERQLNKIYQENEAVRNGIIKLKSDLASQIVKERWKMAAKMAYLQRCEDKLTRKKQQNEQRMRNESEKCQRIIQSNQKSATEEQNVLEAELKELRKEFDKQVKQNHREEKNCRDEKSKFEIQLQSIIRKYDETISQKIIKGMDLQKQLEETKVEMDILMIKYRENEVIYNEIVAKRENEVELEKQRRILRYMMNRAARRIQRYWRKWRKYQLKKIRRQKGFMKKVLK